MNEKPRRPSADIRADIAAAEARLADVEQKIKEAQETIVALKAESRSLYDAGFRREDGTIPDLKRELYAELRREEFDTGIPVVWVDGKRPGFGGGQNYIVTKVTPKRIFIRDDQHFCDEQYKIDGGHPGHIGRYSSRIERIDIQATFGVPEITAKLWAEMKGKKLCQDS